MDILLVSVTVLTVINAAKALAGIAVGLALAFLVDNKLVARVQRFLRRIV